MFLITELNEIIDDEMLEIIFKSREEDICTNRCKCKESEEIKQEHTMTHKKLVELISNIPPHFKESRKIILRGLEEYANRENLLQACDNEKFYKIGFCDGVRMVLEINKKENSV